MMSQEVPRGPCHPVHHSLAPHSYEHVHGYRACALAARSVEQRGLPVQRAATGLGAGPEEGAGSGRQVMDRQGGSMISQMSLSP
jgi:hypothetical protein